MARRVYFAFHFERDIFRINQVRNSNVVAGVDRAGFYDHSEYLEAKKKGDQEIRRLILSKLEGTSVTVVLIGHETASRPWVQFEIAESIKRGNGLLGVFVHHLVDHQRTADSVYPLPPSPVVPAGTECPLILWTGDLSGFSAAIEAAGARADRSALLRCLYPTMFK